MLRVLAAAFTVAATSELLSGNVVLQYDSSVYGSVLEAMSALEAEAKVGDFGLSRKIQHGRSHTSDIRQGTPFFVAPEVTGQRRLHKSSDAYSFGVMMWELCVGCPVYTVQQCALSCSCTPFRQSKASLRGMQSCRR